jgi:outer membrane protein
VPSAKSAAISALNHLLFAQVSTMLNFSKRPLMKNLASILLSALLLSAGTSSAATTKIGIVDMDRIYREYYKTLTNEAELNIDKAAAKEEVDKRLKKFESLRTEFTNKQKKLSDTSLPPAARQKAQKEAEGMVAELESLRRDINDFAQRRQAQIADKLNRMRKDILADLHTFVAERSKEGGYDLVFDKSGRSSSNIEILLFSKDAIDFTNDLLKQVNKDAPVDEKKAAPAKAE